ncbi:MAG TPA: hypothetical protein DEP84_33740 [Chloroflexi bacterium]|nr:hypothetical protein [Chloroflexota bacterium]
MSSALRVIVSVHLPSAIQPFVLESDSVKSLRPDHGLFQDRQSPRNTQFLSLARMIRDPSWRTSRNVFIMALQNTGQGVAGDAWSETSEV